MTPYLIAAFFWLIILAVVVKFFLLPGWKRTKRNVKRLSAYLGRWRQSIGVFMTYKSTLADHINYLVIEIEKLDRRLEFQETVEVKRDRTGQRMINFDLPKQNGARVLVTLPVWDDGNYLWPEQFHGAHRAGYGIWTVSSALLSRHNAGEIRIQRGNKQMWIKEDELQPSDKMVGLDWKLKEMVEYG